MKRTSQPKEAPQPVMMVAVPSLTEVEYCLVCLKPESGYPAGTKLEVLGGNTNAKSLYVPGYTSKYRRIAADFEEYEYEVLLKPLPDLISEIVPAEYPGCFELVITNAKAIQVPVPEVAPKRVCKVIQHPAVMDRVKPAKTCKILPLFPDYPTINQTA